MKNKKINNTDDKAKKLALFKYGLIAPLVNNIHTTKSKSEYFREVASKKHILPSGEEVYISSNTIKSWYRSYIKSGFDVLITKPRADIGKSRKITSKTIEKIGELQKKYPHITTKAIYKMLIKDGYIKPIETSIASLYRYISTNTISEPPKKECKAFEMEYSNDLWQADSSHGPILTINNKKYQTYLIQLIDDASRLIVGAKFFLNDNAINFQQVLKQAIQTYGIPKRVYADNGKPYKNIQLQTICACVGTVLIHTHVYSPNEKGKIERSFKTVQDNFINCTDWTLFSSLEDLNEQYYQYVQHNYNNSIHSSIKTTPKSRFFNDYEHIKFVESKEVLDEMFLHSNERFVQSDATIKLHSTSFEVPQRYIKQKILVKWSYDDLDIAYVYENGKRVETIYPVNKLDNSKIRRKSISYSDIEGNG